MKILLVSDFFPPSPGGMSRHVFSLATGLRRRGNEVTVFTCGLEHGLTKTVEEGVKIVRYSGLFQKLPFLYENPNVRYHPPLGDFLLTKALKELVSEDQPDLIHSHGWILNSVLPVARKTNTPLIHSLHDHRLLCPKQTFLKDALPGSVSVCRAPLTKACITCAIKTYGPPKSALSYIGLKTGQKGMYNVNRYIAVSDYVKQVHLRHFQLDNIVVIPNFYIKEAFDETDRSGLPDDFILYVGALHPDKGIEILIKAYRELAVSTKLVFVGFRASKCSFFKGNKDILVFENAPRSLLLKAYLNCRMVIMPSISPEVFGQVALEAMAFGRPIIGSRNGGLLDVVKDNETGLLVKAGSVQELRDAIRYLLANRMLAENMGSKGLEIYNKFFSEQKVLPAFENLYHEVIEDGGNCHRKS